MQKNLILFYLFCCAALHASAQTVTPQTLNVCGSYINTGYYQLEWSVGEMAIIETLGNATTGYITSGVLQPLTDKPVANALIDNSWDVSEIKIFPSPTTGLFEVNIMTKQQGLLEIQLVDNLGQVLKSSTSYYYGFGRIEHFDITRNGSSNYFLRINLSPNPGFSKKKGSFKILKIN
jgi:hypothetical protein